MDLFEIVFNGFAAFNQIGMLLGGGICLLIGGAILGDSIYTRIAGRRVQGAIVGVRATGVKDSDAGGDTDNDAQAQPEQVKPVVDSMRNSYKQDLFEKPASTLFGTLIAGLFILMPFVFFGFGAYTAYDYANLRMNGIAVTAVIADNESESDSDGTSYYAVVGYTDKGGYYHRVRDKIGTGSSPSYSVGDKVRVYYEADNPAHFIIDDFWHYMGVAIAFMTIPAVFIGLLMLMGRAGKNGQKKKHGIMRYSGEMYYPVYAYKAVNGDIVRIVSDTGSNMLSGKRLGKRVTLLLRGDDPHNARKPGLVMPLVGLVFLVPGILFSYLAVTTFEFSVMTPIVALGLGGAIYFKAKNSKLGKIIKPREMWENRTAFKVRMKKKFESKMTKGRLLTADEIRERMAAYDGYAIKWTPFAALIAVCIMAGGYYMYGDMQEKMAQGLRVTGEIVRIDSKYDSSSDGSGYTYYGVVKYMTAAGESIEFRDSVGSSHALFEKGDQVDVIYDPAKPQKAMIDRGMWNWLLSVGLMAFGAFLMFWSLKSFFAIRSRLSRL